MKTSVKASCNTRHLTLVFSLQDNIRKKIDCPPVKCAGNFLEKGLNINAIGWIAGNQGKCGKKNTAL